MSLALKDYNVRGEILNSDLEKISRWAKQWKVKFNEQKTELLNFSRDHNPMPNLIFGQSFLQDVPYHKHLGIIIQNNCKWDEHIKSIINKAHLLLCCLRTYKYRLSRKALENMYKSFILPIFDYGDVIWDGCTKYLSDELENLNLEAIRTIIGAVRGTSHEKLYRESGLCPLQERRRRHKLHFYHKLVNGNAPKYLIDLLPPLMSTINPYHRRRPLERKIPRSRTEVHVKSFFPSTTRLWNELPEYIQASHSIGQLKHFLAREDPIVPSYFYYGERMQQIIHCKLRLQMSDLNSDLVKRHLLDNPACTCGYHSETANHFLLFCPRFDNIRLYTIDTLPLQHRTAKTLLNGNEQLSIQENENIFSIVHNFIHDSKRFSAK